MQGKLRAFKEFLGPYNYRAGFIYLTILIFNLANLRTHTFDYEFGTERVEFFFLGLLTYLILGIPLFIFLKMSQTVWRSRKKSFGAYLFELLIGSLITLLVQLAGQRYLLPLLETENFLTVGVFFGELVTRFIFAVIFIAITHNRLRTLSTKFDEVSALNSELNERYARLIESDEEIRSHASRVLHDRIQSKLMLEAAKLTRVSGVLTEEGRMGVLPVIKELERIRSIDIREVSQLLSPNLASEGLLGSCENLCKEFEGSVNFEIKIDRLIENLTQDLILGIYRIIEQGVINAIKHGPAKKVSIEASLSLENEVKLEIRDNGPGESSEKSGTGSVIIDAWVSILDGRKEIESVAGKGYTLRVFFSTLENK